MSRDHQEIDGPICSLPGARIAERAADLDARYVITFVTEDNIPSLKGCDRAGFSSYMKRSDKWVGIRRTITFGPLP